MYREAEFRERCAVRGLDDEAAARAVSVVGAMETAAAGPGGTLADASLADIERHVASLVSQGAADETAIMAMARYFSVIGYDAAAIRLLAYLLPVGVLPAMADRLRALEGDAVADRALEGIVFPPTGAAPEEYPAATAAFVAALSRELGPERTERVLTCNVHGVPAAAYAPERGKLLALGSVDGWLLDYHRRLVETLAGHAADGTLWYEQKITQAVVDFVAANQEIQGGVRDGDRIYVSKIPYDPDRFLHSTDPTERRRLACHCPLAASSIDSEGAGVTSAWCACSAGYEKFKFDIAFGESTEATVLSSVLAGDPVCRFAIKVPASILAALT